jgi:glutamate decarboxylase
MNFELPGNGKGKEGLLATVEEVLKYSVNTWDQGFLDKLYASTNAVSQHHSNLAQRLKKFR